MRDYFIRAEARTGTGIRAEARTITKKANAGAQFRKAKAVVVASLLLGLAGLSSCEKELDFKYHEIEPLTVIEGELTPEGARVSLTLTTPMGEPMDRIKLTDAVVTITDLTAGEVYVLTPDSDGIYREGTGGVAGHEYELRVDRNGELRTAKTLMYPPTEILSVSFDWIKMPYDHVAMLQGLYLDDPGQKGDCYWVKVYRNGEIYSWSEMEDRTASAEGVMNYVSMTSRADTEEEDEGDVLRDGDVVTVRVYRISPEMRSYIEAIGNDSNGPEMFSGPRTLGYFMANAPVEESVVFREFEMSN